jgi:hypothetical protein
MLAFQRAIVSVILALIGANFVYAADPPNPIGMPKKGDPGGGIGAFRIWHADGKWHLRTSTDDTTGKKEKLIVFTGSVRCETKITAEGVRLEKGNGKTADTITPHRDGKGFDFRFATYGAIDEALFTIADGGKNLKFKLQVDGKDAPANRILIGTNGDNPEKPEFTLPAFPKK